MKTPAFILLVFLSSFSAFAQFPKGFYFQDIKGTAWLSSEDFHDSVTATIKGIGLIYLNHPIDSLKENSIVWFFNDSLTIQSYDAATHKTTVVLRCPYNKNERERKITIFLKHKDVPEITFDHISISTGNYISLTREKKKKATRK